MLSVEQQKAYDRILNGREKILTLGGVAGSGKSHLVSEIAKQIKVKVVTPTWKAALVLHERGFPDACTIHQLFLRPTKDDEGNLIFVEDEEKSQGNSAENALLVVDEASMVNKYQYDTITDKWGGRILFVGDHAQLPPIGGSFSVMEDPDILLTEIHRQAAGSPIIRLATAIRTGDGLDKLPSEDIVGETGYAVGEKYFNWATQNGYQIICGMNSTRTYWNRKLKKGGALPTNGDSMILLDNQPWNQLYNGMMVEMKREPEDQGIRVGCRFNDGARDRFAFINTKNLLNPKGISAQKLAEDTGRRTRELGIGIDYAYAITCHKAQGSSFKNVSVSNEAWGNQAQRWLYTAVTRAEKKVILDKL